MIVVSDTSPINYLILIGEAACLERLFGCILMPPAVHCELLDNEAPEPVRAWAAALPDWVEVRAPLAITATGLLGQGESEALSLAEEKHAVYSWPTISKLGPSRHSPVSLWSVRWESWSGPPRRAC